MCKIKRLLQEYEDLVVSSKSQKMSRNSLDWEFIASKLQEEGDWTKTGAKEIVSLARNYGFFMLKNAFALAMVLGIEDGELGF